MKFIYMLRNNYVLPYKRGWLLFGGLVVLIIVTMIVYHTRQESVIALKPVILTESKAQGVTLDNNQLLKDGSPFVPRGVGMIGLLAPSWCTDPSSVEASSHFGQPELAAAKAWGVNTIRFQISQEGMARDDYQSYLDSIVIPRVLQTRAAGFVVILSMQDEHRSCGPSHALPSQQTLTAWQRLNGAMKASLGADFDNVLLELFNEPRGRATAAGWKQWEYGGVDDTYPVSLSDNKGDVPIGHQQLVDAIRGQGITNVLLAEGTVLAHTLKGVPLLKDTLPTRNIGYAIHTYGFETYKDQWGSRFSDLSQTRFVLVTEGFAGASTCGSAAQKMGPEFLDYLKQKNIGIIAAGLDNPSPNNSFTTGWDWQPTQCGTTTVGGSGLLFQDYLHSFSS